MTWTAAPGAWGSADPLFLLLIALGVEAYIGGRRLRAGWRGNPRRIAASLCLDLARRLNRADRSAPARRRRGVAVAGALALGAMAAGWLAALVTRHYPFAWTLELFLLIFLIDQRATWRLGETVQEGLASGSLVRAREALRPLAVEAIPAAQNDALGREAVVTATLAALGRRFASCLMAPVVWYVVLGLPGLFLQQISYIMATVSDAQPLPAASPGAANTPNPYGDGARSLARAVALLPDLVAALLLGLGAAFVPGGRGAAALGETWLKGDPAAKILGAAFAGVNPAARINRALVAFAAAGLINAALIGALALIRLTG
jgi:adenosylcobinamide-phosphate synthase